LQEITNPGNPHEFDYKKYLSYNLISKQAYLKSGEWKLLKSDSTFHLKALAERIRKKVIKIFKTSGIEDEELAVLSALSLGYKDDLDADIQKSYSSSGAMHVLAVSGLHVGIVFLVFNFLLFFLQRNKWLKILKGIILLLLLWAYATMTGLSPSVIRATTMFSFIVMGNMLGKYTNIYNSLAASAFLLLLANPFNITNIGFQFSYLAVIGIVFFYPMFYGMIFVKNKWLDKVWSLICVSLAAQLITGPLSIYYFNQFPNYFILTNLIVIPFATILIYEAIILLCFSWFPWMQDLIGQTTSYCVRLLNDAVQWIEHLPGSVTTDLNISTLSTIVLYVFILAITFYFLTKKALPFIISLTSIACFIFLLIWQNIKSENRKEFYVYNINKYSAINLVDGNNNLLFTDLLPSNKQYSFSMKNNWLSMGLEKEKTIPFHKLNNQFIISNLFYLDNPNVFYKDQFFSFYDTRFAIISDDIPAADTILHPVHLDFVIISANAPVKIKDIMKVFKTKQIIIDSSNSAYKTKKWKEEAEKMDVNLYVIKEKGAFYIDISS
jgi:competence protein ComEC